MISKIVKRFASRLSIAGEAQAPSMRTSSLPGPKSTAFLERLGNLTNTASMDLPLDLEKSLGNYCRDLDGNEFLDLSSQSGSLSLGYNNPEMLEFSKSPAVSQHLNTRMALAVFPSQDADHILRKSFVDLLPRGLDYVFPTMCDDCSIEVAIKLVTIEFMGRGRADPSVIPQLELDSCMTNSLPGTPEVAILSFEGSAHGKLFGGISTSSQSDAKFSGLPRLKWPKVQPPEYKYPLAHHTVANEVEDERVLAEVLEVINSWEIPVAGVILEPIQGENNGNTFSSFFARGLQELLQQKGISLIVDETQSGYYSTGKRWAYEHWNLLSAPEFVCSSKKTLSGVVFTQKRFLAPQAYRHFNTWFGDTPRLAMLSKQNEILSNSDVEERVRTAGDYIRREVEKMVGPKVQGVRGWGTYLTIEFWSGELRDQCLQNLRRNGVLVASSGVKSINLRPSLIFGEEHSKVFVDLFSRSL